MLVSITVVHNKMQDFYFKTTISCDCQETHIKKIKNKSGWCPVNAAVVLILSGQIWTT